MSKPGLDGRHGDKNGKISSKHGDTLVRALRKIYGQGFAAGYPETAKLSEVLLQLNETSLSQLRRDQVDAGHEISREWRSLPREQRQTDEQAAAFAMQIKDKYKF
jgi:hypothetical protein